LILLSRYREQWHYLHQKRSAPRHYDIRNWSRRGLGRGPSVFVIDEADEMLKMGFIDDVDLLVSKLPESAKKWMFSATMPKEIVRLMEEKLDNPELIRVMKSTLSNKSITQSYSYLERKDFFKALKMILLTEEEFYGIVFCETREETKKLADSLLAIGEKAAALHGDLNQNQRDYAMSQFKSKKIDILVCTDVAARGVDVTNVTHVINMGLPRKPDSYVHRIGRTGRAGKVGKAISFLGPKDYRGLQTIERLINDKLEKFVIPTAISSKRNKINSEIDRMSNLKKVFLERKDDFSVDQSFTYLMSF
jgi:ATP-dependent RNA helicase DeaD